MKIIILGLLLLLLQNKKLILDHFLKVWYSLGGPKVQVRRQPRPASQSQPEPGLKFRLGLWMSPY